MYENAVARTSEFAKAANTAQAGPPVLIAEQVMDQSNALLRRMAEARDRIAETADRLVGPEQEPGCSAGIAPSPSGAFPRLGASMDDAHGLMQQIEHQASRIARSVGA